MIDVDIEQTLGDFELRVAFRADVPVVGVFGRSGAGKTSVINAIAGVATPRGGHIRVGGVTLFESGHVDLPPPARRVGYVFQDALLFPHMSVRANLLYGHRLRKDTARFIDLARVIDVLGLASLLARRPDTLSGGEKQRVAIGRTLLSQPRILLLDEPLASLDGQRKDEILDYIERLRDEFHIPIVYVSHSVAEIARLADAVVVLEAGRCAALGAPGEVLGRAELSTQGRYDAGSVIETTVLRHDERDQMTTLGFAGGELTVPLLTAPVGRRVRAHIRARDVSLALVRPDAISIVNILPARVSAVREQSGGAVDVELAIGDATLVARITQRSCTQLAIHAQQPLFALVKAVSFDHLSGAAG